VCGPLSGSVGQVSQGATWKATESGGSDLGTMHVNVDDESRIEWYAEFGDTDNFLYPVGWWTLPP
jgi:hypothetical protein